MWRTVILLWLCGAAVAAEPRDLAPPNLEQVLEKGLFFLQRMQKGDGSFESDGSKNAMTGLGLLAYMACGNTPGMGRFGQNVSNAADYLAAQGGAEGYWGNDGSKMYGHCIVVIALAEVYGMEGDEGQRKKIRSAIDRGLKTILTAQDVKKDKENAGGWRYEPNSADSDLSVTGWCMAAIRACQNAGIPVPKERGDLAMGYVMRCWKADKKGFAYQPKDEASPAMTGVGVLNLCLMDQMNRPEVAAGGLYLVEHPVKDVNQYYYYSLYYTLQAAYQVGDKTYEKVWKNNSEQLLALQRKEDGAWPHRGNEPGGEDKKGRVYSTAMAILTLSVPLKLLPMYQR